jgi:hypothetical protein
MQRAQHLIAAVLMTASIALAGPSVVTGSPLLPLHAGGDIRESVVAGDIAYLTEGASISIWQLSSDGSQAPVRLGATEPLAGAVNGLAVVGDSLFATWATPYPYGQLAVYSLTDPANPVHELDFEYATGSFLRPSDVIAIGDVLLLTDPESGVYAIDVSDPLAPSVTDTEPSFGLERLAITGNHALGWGRSFIGGFNVEVFDVTTPSNPSWVGFTSSWGNYVNGAVSGDTLILVGDGFEVISLANPAMPVSLTTVPNWGTYIRSALMDGDLAFLGDENGVHVWDLSTPSSPVAGTIVSAPADRTQAGVIRPTSGGEEALLFSAGGWGMSLDLATPAFPTLEHTFDLPVGSDSQGVVELAGGNVAVIDFYSGLRLHDGNLDSLGRVDPGIPMGGYEALAVEGTTAYVASWGYGLLTMDISDHNAPAPLGSVAIPFASGVDTDGSFAYVVTSTNGGVFQVVDVSDPGLPVLRGSMGLSKGLDVLVHNGLALVADDTTGDAGLRIVDVSLPDAPIQLGSYTLCDSGGGVAADGDVVYLACLDGSLHVVSIADPAMPTQLGMYDPAGYSVGYDVAVDGTTAWFGHTTGFSLLNVSDPANPTLMQKFDLPADAYDIEIGAGGSAWMATGLGGVYQAVSPVVFFDGFESGDTSAWASQMP